MKIKFIMLLISIVNLTACSGGMHKVPVNDPSDDATIKLAEAANSINDQMVEMAKIEKALTPPNRDNTLTIPNASGLQRKVTVDWSGPIEELTHKIARASRYRLRILGQEPAIPILVTVSSRDNPQSLADILRNIDYQAGNKASIHVYPNQKIIELRYANLYS
jgi:defect-in-organelle-trafficking protein DotD